MWQKLENHINASGASKCPNVNVNVNVASGSIHGPFSANANANAIEPKALTPCPKLESKEKRYPPFTFAYPSFTGEVLPGGCCSHQTMESLFCLTMPLEHIDFHFIGYWTSSI